MGRGDVIPLALIVAGLMAIPAGMVLSSAFDQEPWVGLLVGVVPAFGLLVQGFRLSDRADGAVATLGPSAPETEQEPSTSESAPASFGGWRGPLFAAAAALAAGLPAGAWIGWGYGAFAAYSVVTAWVVLLGGCRHPAPMLSLVVLSMFSERGGPDPNPDTTRWVYGFCWLLALAIIFA